MQVVGDVNIPEIFAALECIFAEVASDRVVESIGEIRAIVEQGLVLVVEHTELIRAEILVLRIDPVKAMLSPPIFLPGVPLNSRRFFGSFRDLSLVQSQNAISPMVVSESGRLTVSRFRHLSKADVGIAVTPSSKVTFVIELHCARTLCPIEVTVPGIVI